MVFLWDVFGVGQKVNIALRNLTFNIFEALLKGINDIYKLFFTIIDYDIWMDNEIIKGIFLRIELILGIFMVFRLTFSAIQYIINPDDMNDSKKGVGNIVKKVMISVILLGSVHYLFQTAIKIQNIALGIEGNNGNIIEKIILGPSEQMDEPEAEMSWVILDAFYKTNEDSDCKLTSVDKEDYIEAVKNNNENLFTNQYNCLEEENGGSWEVDFRWLFGIATAVVVLWVLLTYTIQLGIRGLQLAYLEIISPIPIMMYINPNGDETLKKWGNQCLSTYVDVFLRIAILDFIIVCFEVLSTANLFEDGTLLGIILLIALLMFAKKIPDLIKDIFPSIGGPASLDLGIKSPKQAFGDLKSVPGIGLAAIGAGAIVGGAGKLAKKGAGAVWKNTGGRAVNKMKGKLTSLQERNEGRREYNDKVKEIDKVHEKYGNDFESGNVEKVFDGNKDYITSYNNLQAAKAAAEEKYDKNSYEYEQAIKSAKDEHEIQRNRNKQLAAREDALKDYKKYHPQSSDSSSNQHINDDQNSSIIPPNTTITASGIIIPSSTFSSTNNIQDNQSGPTREDEYQQLINRYNNASSGPERDQISREIDEFERNH